MDILPRQRIVHPSKPVWWERTKNPITGTWTQIPHYGTVVKRVNRETRKR